MPTEPASGSTRRRSVVRRKALAEAIQVRISEFPTHAHLGQYNFPSARHTSLSGNLEAPVLVFRNIRKKD